MHSAVRRWIRYPIEAAAAWLCLGFFGLMAPGRASAVGGWIGRTLGPLLPVNRRAKRNIALAMPTVDATERRRIIRGMWENLGRVVAEYPHLEEITRPGAGYVEVVGAENADVIRDGTGGGLLVSGHFANWEVFALTARANGVGYAQVYRAANNPLVDRMIVRARRLPAAEVVPKGAVGARRAIEVLRRGGRVGLLADQKLNDGIPIPFFGHDAMTAPAVAQLAHRFGRPVVPTCMERLGGCRFRFSFHPGISPRAGSDRRDEVNRIMREINEFLEARIRERPEQWLWLHRRWPEQANPISARAASVPPAARDPAASGTN